MSNRRSRAIVRQDRHGTTLDVATQELPLPPPEALKIYHEILPEAPERLLKQTEENHLALRESTRQQIRWQFQRLWLSFIASAVGLGSVFFMAHQQTHPAAIIAVAIGSFGISVFHSLKNR